MIPADELARLRELAQEVIADRARVEASSDKWAFADHSLVAHWHVATDPQTILSLLDALEQVQVDARRLDWLDRDDIELRPCTRVGEPWVQILRSRDGALIAQDATIRAAIDAALARQEQHE